MREILKFGTAVVYVDDVPATLTFYRRATGLEPSYYDEKLGFAILGSDQAVAIALTPPRTMPWGQTVAYVRAPEGTILGFVTRVGEAVADA